MDFRIEEQSSKGITSLCLSHAGQVLHWATPGYSTASIPDREHLFDDPNALLRMLEPETQHALWDLYKDIHTTLTSLRDPVTMHKLLVQQVTALYELIDYRTARHYVYVEGNLILPSDLKTSYGERDLVDRTYLKSDYIELAVFVLGLRFMIPIWGAYIAAVVNHTHNEYKEKTAVELIVFSKLQDWPARERLKAWVEVCSGNSMASLSTLLSGLSTIEIPRFLMALAMVRKLAVSPLSARSDDDNLIKILHNFIDGTAKRLDGKFNNTIGDKTPIKDRAEDDNSSVWDMYKIVQPVPDGDKVLIEVYTTRVEQMARSALPEYNPERLQLCLDQMMALTTLPIELHQEAFTQWILAPQIPMRGIQCIPKLAVLRCMAVAQLVLWEWGFTELAALMTGRRLPRDTSRYFDRLEGRNRIPKDMVVQLDALYPHYRQRTRKHDPAKRDNPAIKAIDTICDSLISDEWSVEGPAPLLAELDTVATTRQLACSPDIRIHLAQLVIKLNHR